MKKIKEFDLLIVYSEDVARSAKTKNLSIVTPFPKKSKYSAYNDSYEYFLKTCQKNNLKAAFTTTKDINKNNGFNSYWLYKNNNWIKVNKPCKASFIFDKFFPITKKLKFKRTQILTEPSINTFTNEYLLNLFHDKYETYKKLTEFSIPTASIKNKDMKSIKIALDELKRLNKKNPNKNDFSEKIILKDRYGAGGNNIYKIETEFAKKIYEILSKNKKLNFIIQPFVNFDKGYQYEKYPGPTEIRFVYLGKKIVQTYIRVAENDDFLCNHGKGGIWVSLEEIPKEIIHESLRISDKFNKKDALFALDFIVSNEWNIYLLEANTSPGIDWHKSFPKNVKMNKALIDIIVDEIFKRIMVQNRKIALEKTLIFGKDPNYLLN